MSKPATRPPLTPAALAKLRGGVDFDALAEAEAPRSLDGDSLATDKAQRKAEATVGEFVRWVIYGNRRTNDLAEIDADAIADRALAAGIVLNLNRLADKSPEKIGALPMVKRDGKKLRKIGEQFRALVLAPLTQRPDAGKPAP